MCLALYLALKTFSVSVLAFNGPPTLQALPDQTVRSNGFLILPITLGDADHDARTLEISVQSSNPSVVANENLVISGEGANRNLNLTPVRGSSGIA